MKLLYIGTGAADWTPTAGARDGMTRRFTCTLVDETLLIDLAPTTPAEMFSPGATLGRVTDILYTHSHDDHYDADTLTALAAERQVRIWLDADFASRVPPIPGVEVHPLTVGTCVTIGNYTVTPLRANHALRQHPDETALHYIISDGTRRIFWGADGAWLPTDTWRLMIKNRPYDRIILDGTLGEARGDARIFEHNNLPMVRLAVEAFASADCIADGGEVWLTHLSRDAHESPLVLKKHLAQEGLHMAEDDLEDEF